MMTMRFFIEDKLRWYSLKPRRGPAPRGLYFLSLSVAAILSRFHQPPPIA
jgi:hypothetical protein